MTTSNYSGSTTGAPATGTDEIEILQVEGTRPVGSRIRGSAVWCGAAVAIATFVLLEMLLLATDLSGTQVSVANPDTGSWVWDGIAAILAFFAGGMVAAASVPYRGTDTGALNGAVVWATTIVGLVVLTGLVGGATFGALGDLLASNQDTLFSAAQETTITEAMAEDARDAAGWSAIGLIATLIAAVCGGITGIKTWPSTSTRMMDEVPRRTRA